MAKRDVDIIIGARTDDASFQRASRKTNGMLARLRSRAGNPAIQTEQARDAVLQRTSRAAETISKIAQAAVLLKEGAAAFNAALEIGSAIRAQIAGDIVARDDALLRTRDLLNQTTGGSIGGALGETFFGDQAEADRIAKQAAENQKRNDEALKRTNAIRVQALNIIEREGIAQRLFGKEGVELAREQARIRHESAIEEIQLMMQRNQNAGVAMKLAEAQAAVETSHAQRMASLDEQQVKAATRSRAREVTTANITSGLLLSGNAAAARADGSVQFVQNQGKQIRLENETAKNTRETVQALQQLIQATNLQSASRPFLN
ncbi:MAG: hypothetical protein AAF711_08245 [Planctomycetota bacterium]